MLVRAIALSLALLIGGAVIIPLATANTEAGPRHKRKKHRRAHYKKYSKRWWRQYRARQRRLKALRAKRRALRLQNLRLAEARAAQQNDPVANARPQIASLKPVKLPSGQAVPEAMKVTVAQPTELQFRVDNNSGEQIGSAAISVVGPSNPSASFPNGKSVGGVSTNSLRRDVIDKMIRENGWVVNDYQQEIAGQNVYVVVGQSQARNGQIQQRMFYFTEVEGKIYSVATSSPVAEQERLANESEKVINSLKSRVRPALRASLKEE